MRKNAAVELLAALLACCACASASWAQAAPETHAQLTLVADSAARGARWVGVLFKLDPGWHVYWQNAGDSGEPPKVKWEVPAGLRVGDIRWPTPKRLGGGTVIDYGYEGHVLLMAPIERSGTGMRGATGPIGADVRYVVCREICIPGKAHVTLDDTAAKADAGAERMFAETRAALPRKMPAGWSVSATQDKASIVLTVKTGGVVKSGLFFPLDASVIENAAPQKPEAVAGGFRLRLKKSEQLLKPAEKLDGLIVVAPGKSYEIAAAVSGQ